MRRMVSIISTGLWTGVVDGDGDGMAVAGEGFVDGKEVEGFLVTGTDAGPH